MDAVTYNAKTSEVRALAVPIFLRQAEGGPTGLRATAVEAATKNVAEVETRPPTHLPSLFIRFSSTHPPFLFIYPPTHPPQSNRSVLWSRSGILRCPGSPRRRRYVPPTHTPTHPLLPTQPTTVLLSDQPILTHPPTHLSTQDSLLEEAATVEKWLAEKEAAQAAKEGHEEPAYLSTEVAPQLKKMKDTARRLGRKPVSPNHPPTYPPLYPNKRRDIYHTHLPTHPPTSIKPPTRRLLPLPSPSPTKRTRTPPPPPPPPREREKEEKEE